MKRARLCAVALAAVAALCVAAGVGAQSPASPHRFAGSVSVDGEGATAGTSVTAIVNGSECGSATVITGASGSSYAIDVPSDCAEVGDIVAFRVGGYEAAETRRWRSGGRTAIDLTVHTYGTSTQTCPEGWEWNAITGECAPTEPAVAPAEPAEPVVPATANVEVTVWRSISNPSLLYLSTRPEGGRWHTEDTALDMSARSRSGRFNQSNAITVAVSLVGGGAANVEVTVWRSISNPALLYLSTRSEGGRWHTEDTALDMSARSRSGRFNQSNPVTVAVPLPASEAPAEPAENTTVPADRSQCRIDEAMAARVIASTVKVVTPTGSGSAFYIGNGEFVTAAHVVDDRPSTITLRNERLNVSAHIVGYTSRDDGDLAILSASAPGMAALEWSGAIGEGAEVAIVGYPLGQGLRASISRGIVSRTFTDEAGVSQLQTDAPANPGNSGGPLVDACGRVAGVVSWKIVRDSQGNATEGLAFVVGEPSTSTLLRAIRSGQYSPPATTATPSGPTWAQMDALVDSVSEHWGATIDGLNALVDLWNASDDSIPSNTLANIARQQRDLSRGMVNSLAGLRSDPAALDSTLSDYLEAAISWWSSNVKEYEELEQYALDRATWGSVLWKIADSEAAFAAHRRAQCAVWQLLYSNPEVVCDEVAAAEQAAADAGQEARNYTPPSTTTPPEDASIYSKADVWRIVGGHRLPSGRTIKSCAGAHRWRSASIAPFLGSAIFENGVWRLVADPARRWLDVYFTEATATVSIVKAPCYP